MMKTEVQAYIESERDMLYREFERARQNERQHAGKDPDVCLAGEHWHDALVGCLICEFPPHLIRQVEISKDPFLFRGVRIYKTHSFKTGFLMGVHDP